APKHKVIRHPHPFPEGALMRLHYQNHRIPDVDSIGFTSNFLRLFMCRIPTLGAQPGRPLAMHKPRLTGEARAARNDIDGNALGTRPGLRPAGIGPAEGGWRVGPRSAHKGQCREPRKPTSAYLPGQARGP